MAVRRQSFSMPRIGPRRASARLCGSAHFRSSSRRSPATSMASWRARASSDAKSSFDDTGSSGYGETATVDSFLRVPLCQSFAPAAMSSVAITHSSYESRSCALIGRSGRIRICRVGPEGHFRWLAEGRTAGSSVVAELQGLALRDGFWREGGSIGPACG